MGIAHIIAGPKFDGVNMKSREFLEDLSQRQLRQQRGKDSNAHTISVSSNQNAHSIAASLCYLYASEREVACAQLESLCSSYCYCRYWQSSWPLGIIQPRILRDRTRRKSNSVPSTF